MNRVEVVRRFDAPPEAVWEVYTDHARWSEWAGFPASRLEREGEPHRNGTGAVRALGGAGFFAREEILAFEPPKRMTYRLVGGPVPMKNHEGEVVFEPEGGGTRIVWRCRFDSRIPGLGGLLRRGVAKFFRDALEGLATHRFPDATGAATTLR